MLTPDQLDTIPDAAEALFRRFDDSVMKIYADAIKRAGMVSATAEWVSIRADAIGIAEEELQKETARVLDLSDEEIRNTFENAAFTSAEADVSRFQSAGLNASRIMNSDFLMQYVEAAWGQTRGEFFNLGGTTGFVIDGNFRNFTEALIKELDMTQLQVSSGILDYRSAVKKAVNRAAARGTSVVMYESGYRMNVASAARMITLTGVNQLARRMNDGICDELGLDLVEVTAHAGARPSHREWQGGVFSRSGNSRTYPPLVESTGLGSVDGLCGANCRHNYYGYYEGSPRAYSSDQLQNIDPEPFEYNGKTYDYYDAGQHMRYMERQMRKVKREICGYESAELEDDVTSSKIKLRRMRQEYRKFASASGIRPRYERTEYIKGT